MITTDLISKEAVIKSISEMPDRVSIEALFDKIIYLYKIETGLAQSQRAEGASMEEIRKKVKSWPAQK